MKTQLLFLFVFLPFLTLAQAPTDTVDIPDPHFKWALLHPNYYGNDTIDTNNDSEIEYGEAEAITHLKLFNGILGNMNSNSTVPTLGWIEDLTGIEAFINLTYLDVSYNKLDSLSLTENTALDSLYCYHNELTYLDVTHNPNLKLLWCQKNFLNGINVSQNLNLKELDLANNYLASLSLNGNPVLNYVNCSNNHIDSLNLQINSDLQRIFCSHNTLSYLNVRNNNNADITTMIADNNPNLTCIFVDDKNYASSAPNWQKDSTAHWVETEAECETFGVVSFPFQTLRIYPNPVRNMLYIKAKQNLDKLELFDLRGKLLLSKLLDKTNTTLKVNSLSQGVYFLKISSDQQSITRKIIKL